MLAGGFWVFGCAAAAARNGATQRSVVFAAFTADEHGGLGAEYYANRPVYPLAGTVADINIDAWPIIGRADPDSVKKRHSSFSRSRL